MYWLNINITSLLAPLKYDFREALDHIQKQIIATTSVNN